MRVSIGPIRRAGNWGYLVGSWWEATPHFIVILINTGENDILMYLFIDMKCAGDQDYKQ